MLFMCCFIALLHWTCLAESVYIGLASVFLICHTHEKQY